MAQSRINGFFSPYSSNHSIKYILFDVFGTVVDFRGTMDKEFKVLFAQKGINHITCDEFIEYWINAYSENMMSISEGRRAFATVDELNNIALTNALEQFQIYNHFNETEREHVCMIWHRLTPWPDSVSGISQLKEHFKTGTLSNGNIQLLEDLSQFTHITWDRLLSGELFGCYKPNPVVYQRAAEVLELPPSQILLVASHKYDLEAARQCGFKTAYIFRPLEFKVLKEEQIPRDREFDFIANGIDELAEQLRLNSSDVMYYLSKVY